MAKGEAPLTRQSRPKVKSGCITCRTRRVKCDESRPFCHRCVTTGRTCDGYPSVFRYVTSEGADSEIAQDFKSNALRDSHLRGPPGIRSGDIDRLDRYFSIKTIFGVNLGCNDEAKCILEASLTDPPIRHAVTSLITLRQQLELSETISVSSLEQSSAYKQGLWQYQLALNGLVSNLSSGDPDGLRSALLCCQIFISIEQVRWDHAALAQHVIRGLSILREYRARPTLVRPDQLASSHHVPLPLLDVFLIKLMSAPCKYTDDPMTSGGNTTPSLTCPMSLDERTTEHRDLRVIVPDMKTELTRIATTVLAFLENVSRLDSPQDALLLLTERASLLDSLQLWLTRLDRVRAITVKLDMESLTMSFMRFFHVVLKIILLGTLETSPESERELHCDNDRLLGIAHHIHEQLQAYKTKNPDSVAQ